MACIASPECEENETEENPAFISLRGLSIKSRDFDRAGAVCRVEGAVAATRSASAAFAANHTNLKTANPRYLASWAATSLSICFAVASPP